MVVSALIGPCDDSKRRIRTQGKLHADVAHLCPPMKRYCFYPTGKSLRCFPKWLVQPLLQKYFPSHLTQISSLIRTVPSQRGALRTSSTWGGMRWTRQRQAMPGD